MKNKKIFIIFTVFIFFVFISCSNKNAPTDNEGDIYIIKILLKDSNSVVYPFPNDSIFVIKRMGIEKNMVTNDRTDYNYTNKSIKFKRSYKESIFNLIDFKVNMFVPINPSNMKQRSSYKWETLANKKIGFEWNYNLYNGEKYTIEKENQDKTLFYKISFIGSSKSHCQGCKVTIFIDKSYSSRDINLYPDLEKKFKGRFSKIIIEYPNNGGMMQMEINKITSGKNKIFSILKDLK